MKTFLLILAFAACCVAVPFPVAENSKPVAEIIIDANADIILKHAGEELQHWLKEITGAELPILSQAGDAPRRIRLTTVADVLAKYPADAARLKGNEGYAVRPDVDDLYLFGTCPKGVLNGVYRLLRRNTDIIWARPNEAIGTIFTPAPTLILRDTDHIDVPVFKLRGWKTWPLSRQELMWSIRHGANWSVTSADKALREERLDWGINQEMYFGHNTIGGYMPRSLFWKDHPEWYSMRNGKRVDPIVLPTGQIAAQLCHSNKEMTKEFCVQLERALNNNPKADRFSVMFEDHWNTCECPDCLAPIPLPDGRTLTKDDPSFQSTRFFLFLNELARFLKEKHPGISLSTEAYLFAEIPPAIPVEDNIRITLCPAFKNVKHPMDTRANEYSWNALHAWAQKKCSQIVMFEYYGYISDIPRALDFSAAGDLRYEAEQGVYGLHSEIAADVDKPSNWYRGTQANVWDNNALYFWVLSQLMWDPHQDVLALRREFLTRAYGAAADDVADYLSSVETAWNRAQNESFYYSNGDNAWYMLGRLGLIPRCRDALARARKHELPQKSRTLLERLAASFEKSEMVNNFERCNSFSSKQLDNSKQFANLIRNGSFEELSNEKPANGMSDWNATGLKDWSVWRKLNVCEYGIAKCAGVNGSTCIYVGSESTPKDTTGEIVGGLPNRQRETVVFLQSPSLQIGESYVIRLKTRVDNVREGRPHLAIRWRNAKNDGWELHHDLCFIAEPRVPGEWTTLEGFFTVPNNTAGISLQIGSTDTRGRVYFDDVELYKVE